MSTDGLAYEETLKDRLADFFSDPSKQSFINIVDSIEEKDYLECKGEWIKKGKLSKHILAMANTEGGAIIIGVSENDDGTLKPTGLDKLRDEATFGDKIEKYIPDSIRSQYSLKSYEYDPNAYPDVANKKFQVIFVERNDLNVPFVSTGSTTGLEADTIYIRRHTKSEKANHSEIDRLIKRRVKAIEEVPSRELSEEIDELEVLYSKLDKEIPFTNAISSSVSQSLSDAFRVKNPKYPDEDLNTFIRTAIFKKKIRIEQLLEIDDIEVEVISPNEEE